MPEMAGCVIPDSVAGLFTMDATLNFAPSRSSWFKPANSLRLDMYPALQLFARPAARPRVVRVQRKRRAGFAADARVAQLVERQQRDVVILRVLPDVARVPAGDRRHPADCRVRQLERL